jgi:inorganic pyrophosphatase
VGDFRLVDKGDNDDKILAVPHTDPFFSEYRDLGDVPMHFREEMARFFSVYKDLEMAEVEIRGWDVQSDAYREIEEAVNRYWEHMQGRT